jgi:hypothetical protein
VVFHAIEGRWIKIGEVQVEFDIRGGRKGEGERRGDLPAAETEERGAMICRQSWQELESARRRIVTEGEKERKEKE